MRASGGDTVPSSDVAPARAFLCETPATCCRNSAGDCATTVSHSTHTTDAASAHTCRPVNGAALGGGESAASGGPDPETARATAPGADAPRAAGCGGAVTGRDAAGMPTAGAGAADWPPLPSRPADDAGDARGVGGVGESGKMGEGVGEGGDVRRSPMPAEQPAPGGGECGKEGTGYDSGSRRGARRHHRGSPVWDEGMWAEERDRR